MPDTIFSGPDTSLILRYLLPSKDRYLNQLQFTIENWRSLYPYTIRLQVEQGQDFVRPNLTLDYFFNYREGGLKLRFFAGKFIYLREKTVRRQFANDRYHLNMTGPNGYEDYTYSDYFFGRNEFDNFYSRQIMIRDGAFKVRTDLLADKVGKTDDWLMALNLDASLPRKLNPLSALPFDIPVHVFLDIGTYAGPWKRGAEGDRFLFNCGLHLPVAKGVVDFYFPIFYNGVYGDYFKSVIPKNRFFKTMSFTINFYTNEIKKINRELEF
jgi:hypothetical protein